MHLRSWGQLGQGEAEVAHVCAHVERYQIVGEFRQQLPQAVDVVTVDLVDGEQGPCHMGDRDLESTAGPERHLRGPADQGPGEPWPVREHGEGLAHAPD